jgi:poly(hydroxyalkanoate) depolymerase family esterase
MKMMPPDAMRRALEEVRAGRLADATSLIQSTLARNGLNGASIPGRPGDGLVPLRPRLRAPRKSAANGGARERFTCAAGSREYVLHLPQGREAPPCGLVLMLHGCTQTPEDFAIGTGMNAQADATGLMIVYAAQSRGDNAQSCWNWFSGADQQQGRGEPAILAGLVRDVAARHDVPNGPIFVAGLSAGAAMAVILGRTCPDVFAGVGAHSGLPYGCARGVTEAFAAMAGQGTGTRGTPADRPLPTIVFHGASDATVASANGQRIFDDTLAAVRSQTEIVDDGTTAGRSFRRTTILGPKGEVSAEKWLIDGLGHAWSGGNPAGSYADAHGPDASAEMIRFFLSLDTGNI